MGEHHRERGWHRSEKGIPVRADHGGLPQNLEKGEKGSMSEKSFMTVDEVAAELRVSKSKAYEVVRELNAEMEKQGYLTIRGRVNAAFFHKKVCYSD